MNSPAITISPLVHLPHAIPTLAQWFYAEWNTFDSRSVAEIEAQLAQYLNLDCIPITFVAHTQGELLGTVSLDIADLPPYDHLSPWLASLYVVREARSAGIGGALVRHVQQFASSHGIGTMYLWTPATTRLYERCGWTALEQAVYCGQRITLMRWNCSPATSPTE